MELFLRTSGAGRSWASPSVFFTVLSTPRIWRAACETGEGVQGASWPLVLNLSAMVSYFIIPNESRHIPRGRRQRNRSHG